MTDHYTLTDQLERDLDALASDFPELRKWQLKRHLPLVDTEYVQHWSAFSLRRGTQFFNVLVCGEIPDRKRREGRELVTYPSMPACVYVGGERFNAKDLDAIYSAILARVCQR